MMGLEGTRIHWRAQTVWHVDFANGNDLNDGLTFATALKTWGQLYARLGADFAPTANVDIYLYNDNEPIDPIKVDGWSVSVPRGAIFVYPTPPDYPLVQIRVHAMTPRTYYTGALTGVQAAAFATNTPYVLTDVNMKGANETPPVPPPNDQVFWYNQTIDWNNLVRAGNHDQQRIRISGGPRSGAVCWTSPGNLLAFAIFGSGANGAIRTGNVGISVPFGYTQAYTTVGITAVVPQVADPYVVEDLQLLYIDRLVMKGNGDLGGCGIAFNGFRFRLVNGGDSQNPSNNPLIMQDGGSIVFVECAFDFAVAVRGSSFGAFVYFVNCSTIDGISSSGPGFVYVDAGVHHLGLVAGDESIMIHDADVATETGAIYAQGTGQAWIGSAQIWDLPGHSRKAGIMCHDGGTVFFLGNGSLYGTNRLWGVDQTGQRAYAIAAFNDGHFYYNDAVANIQNLMTIDGVVKWFGIGISWTRGETAQSVDTAGALTTFRDTTKAKFFDTVANGGFGGRAIDLDTGGRIAPITSPTEPV